ncbi:EAL domain-containing protein [Oxalobacteraceae bacterium]|nr:EAL domain-containing protein [Oxalobacteraceae bacterium]
MEHLSVAVNVSLHQFNHGPFVAQVRKILKTSGANVRRLKLELTESVLMTGVSEVAGKMAALQALGIRFSLDDFGTGYSSLAYLKALPLDQLKIDRSFVNDVLTDPNDAAIARTIVALAHSLQLDVIAEGVETVEQEKFLTAAGCTAFQGYLYGRPVTHGELERVCRGGTRLDDGALIK